MRKDIYKCYRNPIELGWGRTVNYDHDVFGRDALMKVRDNNPRQTVTLEWNSEDILDIRRSQLTLGEEPYQASPARMTSLTASPTYHADMVVYDEGKEIGISTGRMLSGYYQSRISNCPSSPLTQPREPR